MCMPLESVTSILITNKKLIAETQFDVPKICGFDGQLLCQNGMRGTAGRRRVLEFFKWIFVSQKRRNLGGVIGKTRQAFDETCFIFRLIVFVPNIIFIQLIIGRINTHE